MALFHSQTQHHMIKHTSLKNLKHKVLVLIAYAQMLPTNDHVDLFNEARGINFCLSIYLHPYFVYMSRKGFGKYVHGCSLI